MKKSEMKIEKISIKMGDKTVELTLEQAKELKDILNDTFPEPVVNQPATFPYPIYIERPYPYWKQWDTVWCGNTINSPDFVRNGTLTCSLKTDSMS